MKNLLLPLVLLTLTVVSCGPSPEEQAAIDQLKSRQLTLEIQLEGAELSVDHWWKAFSEEKDVDVKYALTFEYDKAVQERDELQKELADVKFKLSQI